VALKPNDKPLSPSASSQRNEDEARRQRAELAPNAAPQPETQNQNRHPLFDGRSSQIADQARQVQERNRQQIIHGARITEVRHPGASPQQKPNDSGTRGARVPG